MTQEVFDLVSQCVAGKAKRIAFVRSGEAVKDFRGAWWALCEKAGLGKFVKDENDKLKWQGLFFHDLAGRQYAVWCEPEFRRWSQ